ncbi:hypothetical protein [Muriicola sp.]|uniref:hypothetical protein n=1 Tax=Muriicola sp. TaxID=2020856 RepID=UPI003C788D88
MKNRIAFFLIGSLVLFNFSCYYDQEIDLSEPLPDIPGNQAISFRTDIEPIFSQSGKDCTVCHNGNVANPDLGVGNAYRNIIASITAGDAEGSPFYQRLPGNGHPIDVGYVIDNANLALIKEWIDRGAENN